MCSVYFSKDDLSQHKLTCKKKLPNKDTYESSSEYQNGYSNPTDNLPNAIESVHENFKPERNTKFSEPQKLTNKTKYLKNLEVGSKFSENGHKLTNKTRKESKCQTTSKISDVFEDVLMEENNFFDDTKTTTEKHIESKVKNSIVI